MNGRETRRITRESTVEETARVRQIREQIAAELPELIARDHLRRESQEETTLSGGLRRAIHASQLSLSTIAAQIGVTPLLLDEFLTGSRVQEYLAELRTSGLSASSSNHYLRAIKTFTR
jgi:hypothetical protein